MAILDGLTMVFDFLGNSGILRMLIVATVLFGLWRGLARAGFTRPERIATWLAVAIPLLAWCALVWRLALAGAMDVRPSAFPAVPIATFVPLLVGFALLTRSRRVAAALDAIPTGWLVGLQVYRILGAVFLVQLALGNLSAFFAVPAGIGDVLVGLLALPVALYVNRDENRGRAIALRWNALGILDLAVALTMGGLSSTGTLQALGLASSAPPFVYPLVMIPAFAVPLSLILHGLSIWQLARRAKREVSSREEGGAALARTPA
jgi:hypothetical protein